MQFDVYYFMVGLEILTLFFLQDTYKELVDYLIEAQSDPENKKRLSEAFSQLTRDLPLTSERTYRIKFKDNFDKFIVNVRGFMLVK